MPKHYWPQVQLQLEITDLDECDFIQYRPANTESVPPRAEEFVVVRVKRDREWFEKNLPIMKAAWDRIVAGRLHGLCELVDEPPAQFKNEIVCELVEENDAGASVQHGHDAQAVVCPQEPIPEV